MSVESVAGSDAGSAIWRKVAARWATTSFTDHPVQPLGNAQSSSEKLSASSSRAARSARIDSTPSTLIRLNVAWSLEDAMHEMSAHEAVNEYFVEAARIIELDEEMYPVLTSPY